MKGKNNFALLFCQPSINHSPTWWLRARWFGLQVQTALIHHGKIPTGNALSKYLFIKRRRRRRRYASHSVVLNDYSLGIIKFPVEERERESSKKAESRSNQHPHFSSAGNGKHFPLFSLFLPNDFSIFFSRDSFGENEDGCLLALQERFAEERERRYPGYHHPYSTSATTSSSGLSYINPRCNQTRNEEQGKRC
jgi:hypothetical protein